LEKPDFYEQLGATTAHLAEGLQSAATSAGIDMAVEHQGGMFGFVFTADGPVRRFEQVMAADIDRFRKFFHGMLERDIYLAPSAFEAGFVSIAHGDNEIDKTLDAAAAVLRLL
jgi:glutamate-1-semialdehyde 2,1-aminomutase